MVQDCFVVQDGWQIQKPAAQTREDWHIIGEKRKGNLLFIFHHSH
jgi:hypothetical protein